MATLLQSAPSVKSALCQDITGRSQPDVACLTGDYQPPLWREPRRSPPLPVSMFSYTRLPDLVDFVESQNDWSPQSRSLGRQTFQEALSQPWLEPEHNCWLLEDGGRIKGFCLVHREQLIGRAVLQMVIDPSFHDASKEKTMLSRALKCCAGWKARVAHVCLPAGSDRGMLLEGLGFSQVRAYSLMLCRKESLHFGNIAPGFTVAPFVQGDEALLTRVQNDAFNGSWGFCSNTVDQIEYRTKMANTTHEGILFLRQGEKTAGYCWTCIVPTSTGVRGIIGMIGVVPEFRGQGISSSILASGMKYLKSIGVEDIGLEVDSNNTPAIRLYTSVGFTHVGDIHWFELDLSRLGAGSF